MVKRQWWTFLSLLIMLGGVSQARAQELAPRAHWPAPVGTQLAILGYQFSTGDIITDPTLPFSGVESDIHGFALGYQRFFGLYGRTASFLINAPYTWGRTEGFVEDQYRTRDLGGMADMRLRLAVNLAGAPAMDSTGMQELRASPRTIAGFSLTLSLPTGAYDSQRILNEGTNRWALKPAVGVIVPLHPTWLLELEASAWIFGDNHDYLGQTRRQDPIWAGEAHLVKRFRPGFWLSLDLNYYAGGETWIEGGAKASLQRNSRAGATMVFPVMKGQALRLAYSNGVATRTGGDYRLYSVNYVFAWR